MYLNGQNIRLSDNTAGDGALIVDTRAYFGGHVTASSNLTANKVAIGSTVTPTAQLEVYGQQKWFTSTGDGSELRGLFAPGGAADDPQLTMYKADGTTAGIKLTPDGIDFSANSNAAGMTSELLDDYEEGTFTATVVGGTTAGEGTYSRQVGVYTKIGNLVTTHVWIQWSAHTGTGDLFFGGFPFTSAGTTNYRASGVFGYLENLTLSAGHTAGLVIVPSSTQASVGQNPVGGGAAGAGVSMDSAANIHFSITYQTT
jgi:hypothetical protein